MNDLWTSLHTLQIIIFGVIKPKVIRFRTNLDTHLNSLNCKVVAGDVAGNLTSHCFQPHTIGRTGGFHATVLPSAISLPRSHKLRRHCVPILKLDERGGLLADCDGQHVEFWKEGRESHGTGHWECLRILR